MSEKHLDRYVTEFAGRHNVREFDVIGQMAFLAKGMVGKNLHVRSLFLEFRRISLLTYRNLTSLLWKPQENGQ